MSTTLPPGTLAAADAAALANNTIACKTAVLVRLFTLYSAAIDRNAPEADFGGLHDAEFWEGLSDMIREIAATSGEIAQSADMLFKALQGGAR